MDEENKFDKLTQMLTELGRGNFEARVGLDTGDDVFNTILAGLNMLGEELKFYKQQLDANAQLLQNTIRNIGEIVYSIHLPADGNGLLKYDFISPRVNDLLGYADDDIRQDAEVWLRAIHPDDRNIFETALHSLKNGSEVTCEYRISSNHEHTYIWLEDRMWPKAAGDGNITVAFGCARDITLQKAENAEREKLLKELSNKFNELMQFSYIVSHNLRSPVSTILASCNLLTMSPDEEETEQAYNCIRQSAENMDALLKDLNVILSTKSMINEKFEEVNVGEALENILHALESGIENAGASFHIHVVPQAERISTIKGYIQSCLYNLISNAIKYRSPERPPVISIKVWKELKTVYFEISDNGIGIDLSRHQKKIFGLYQRFTNNIEGKGLGLHMTKLQVEALGGSISVQSEPGIGSTFTFSIGQ